MDPIQASLTKKLDELESEICSLANSNEMILCNLGSTSLRRKLSFIKSLLAAETGGATTCGRLSHIATRVSTIESMFSEDSDDPSSLRLALLRNNVRELESMAQTQDISYMGTRISCIDEGLGNLNAENGALSLNKNIEELETGNKGDDYDDVQRKIECLRYALAVETKSNKREQKAGNDDAFGSYVSSSCSCTSSCFDMGEEKEKQPEQYKNYVSAVNETVEVCSEEIADVKKGSMDAKRYEERRSGNLRIFVVIIGVIAVAAIGVAVRSFFTEKEIISLLPT